MPLASVSRRGGVLVHNTKGQNYNIIYMSNVMFNGGGGLVCLFKLLLS